MSDTILHPMMVHMPLAASVLLPVLWAGLFYFTRRHALPNKIWNAFWLLSLVLNVANALAFWTGTRDARFSKAAELILDAHHEASLQFVGCGALLLALASWHSFRSPHKKSRPALRITLLLIALLNLALAIRVGHLGGYMVFGTDTQ